MSKDKLPKKAAKKVNKLLIAMVIGGAIGSVAGATMTNKTGKENREILKQKSHEAMQKGRKLLEAHQKEMCKSKKCDHTFWHILNKLFVHKKDDDE